MQRSLLIGAVALMRVANASVLPDDRADVFYSRYSGGGIRVNSESVLVRKKITGNLAVEGSYDIDHISGASVDAVSGASVIKDERHQKTARVEYVHDQTTYALSYIGSTERDLRANTVNLSLSQLMFNDLTTLTLAFGRTGDSVGRNQGSAVSPDVVWLGHAQSRAYDVGLSQVLAKNLVGGLNFEVITDAGNLANPYRQIRFAENTPPFYLVPADSGQIYPSTRTSTAVRGKAKYYLPYRAAITGSYRYFSDTWNVRADTYELDYAQPVFDAWTLEGRVRYYKQGHASFYRDVFTQPLNFMARDPQLAASSNTTLGLKVNYSFAPEGFRMFKRGTATLDLSRVDYRYGDYRGSLSAPVTGPFYRFNATVLQAYLSMFF
ncbi:MAG: DUF3570 domain-containing protein [Pseudomonadota bacterium]|nr:DUF3570 domain-containing protein [Pseudomonadota bacterium]